jgi:GMP synthase (glutamine-hydrolysing)
LITIDASNKFLKKLKNITDPEKKRKIIGHLFIDVFKNTAKKLQKTKKNGFKFLVQGTLYPDIVESGGGSGTSNIKSHHNVGGLPKKLGFDLIEPLKNLFKDEVRKIGLELNIPNTIIERQPFPGPGLAIRIIGSIDKNKLRILKKADEIVRNELKIYDDTIWQCPVVLLANVNSVGVSGDERTYGYPVVLRPVTSQDAMTADWFEIPKKLLTTISTKITNEIPEINRVVLDVTQKPPGTIEWE